MLQETQNHFIKKGIPAARLEAELLLAYCLKKDRLRLYMDFESPVTPQELDSFREFVKRRSRREPVAYILGYKEFWSINIHVTQDVLVPRPETEILVNEVLRVLNDDGSGGPKKILELGTGSGAISVALTQNNLNVHVHALDNSRAALGVARQNVSKQNLANRVQLVCGDWLQPFARKEHFDLIVSNPPYICSGDIESLEPEVKYFEPRGALDGGPDGMQFYRTWTPKLPAVLKPEGWVMFELGEGQAQAVSRLFLSSGLYKNIDIVKDYAGHERVIIAQKKDAHGSP